MGVEVTVSLEWIFLQWF